MDEPINNAAYEPLISIIIPVYHVEPYIEKCLNSVLTQSYSNYEAIIVNDGGTSIERDICRAYCDKTGVYPPQGTPAWTVRTER